MQGWGVLTKQSLLTGTFVCCYHGEFLRNEQADARLAEYDQQLSSEGEGHALLVSGALTQMHARIVPAALS